MAVKLRLLARSYAPPRLVGQRRCVPGRTKKVRFSVETISHRRAYCSMSWANSSTMREVSVGRTLPTAAR